MIELSEQDLIETWRTFAAAAPPLPPDWRHETEAQAIHAADYADRLLKLMCERLRCPKHPMHELERTSRQMAKAIAEADAALGEFASHHPREDGFRPFARCVEEAMTTLRGRIAGLEANRMDHRAIIAGLVKDLERSRRNWDVDHACAECVPHSDILQPGFRCPFHAAKALLGEEAPPQR